MAKGRKPLPETLAWLKGDRRRIYKVEPDAPVGEPDMPEYFDDIAKAEWQFMTKILTEMNLLRTADKTALACYCEAWSRYRQAMETVKQQGTVVINKQGEQVKNPYHCVMRHALQDVIVFLREFGLTPTARSKMAIDTREQHEDKWQDLLN